MNELPEWKIPTGISQNLWTYVTSSDVASRYDSELTASPLFRHDIEAAKRFFDRPGMLIDLGCGTGRLMATLAAFGIDSIGVDLSWAMLQVASQRQIVKAQLLRANIVELDALADHAFDYAACLFSTLGMLEREADRRKVLQHVFRILKPAGRFLLHVHNRYFHWRTTTGRRWLWRDAWRRLRGDEAAGNFEPPEGASAPTLHHFSLREVRRLLRQAGFRIQFVDPISLRDDCRLPLSWLLPGLRAHGFLMGCEKPSVHSRGRR